MSEELRAWLERRLGPVQIFPAEGSHGRARTFAIVAGQRLCFARWGLPRRKLEQELRAARQVWGRIPNTPVLIDADLDQGALLMEACPGGPAPPRHPISYTEAGRFLRQLHALELEDEDPLPLDEAIATRAEAAAARIEPDLAAPALEIIDQGRIFRDMQRRWCHRDFQVGNWIWSGFELYVIDWEHARPDASVLDLARLASGPDYLWQAFLEGYGPVEPAALRVSLALHGLVTRAWGLSNRDPAFAEEGRRILAGL